MNRCLTMLALAAFLALPPLRAGENLYVRPDGGDYGAKNGLDWSNAFAGFANVAWGEGAGKVGAGDVLWVAGGKYASAITPKADGQGDKDEQRIIIRRATKQAHGANPGWQDDFDQQVNAFVSMDGRSYVTVDGVTEYGIFHEGGNYGIYLKGTKYVTCQYIHVDGLVEGDSFRGLYSMGNDHLQIRHCKFANCPNDAMLIVDTGNSLFEYNVVDHRAKSASGKHADLGEIRNTHDIVYRYCRHRWEGDGLFFFTADSNWEIYGNLWYDGGKASRIHSSGNQPTNIRFYNNTFCNLTAAVLVPGAIMKNNVGFKLQNGGLPAEGNFLADTDPFVDSAKLDFHLRPNSPARDSGADLGPPYHQDLDGNQRGADGKWDMGAYEAAKPR